MGNGGLSGFSLHIAVRAERFVVRASRFEVSLKASGKAQSFATCRLQVGRVRRVRRVGQWIPEIGNAQGKG